MATTDSDQSRCDLLIDGGVLIDGSGVEASDSTPRGCSPTMRALSKPLTVEGDFPPSFAYRTAGSGLGADIQTLVFSCAERPEMADSRRSGDEIHPWPPNGGLRP